MLIMNLETVTYDQVFLEIPSARLDKLLIHAMFSPADESKN